MDQAADPHADDDTVAGLIAAGERRLAAAGVVCAQGAESPHDEAAAMVYFALGLDHADPLAGSRRVQPAERGHCEALFARRATERLPTGYLLGEACFAGLWFQVDPRVLIPRSPFAELIEARFEPWLTLPEDARILEIGTGSGCIAIACSLAWPRAEVVATDVSPGALAVASANARRHGVEERVRLVCTDLYEGLSGRFDLVISNPPYVPAAELEGMPPEFTWEPRLALEGGGADGLDLVRAIVAGAAAFLVPDGLLAVEVGGGLDALEAAFPRVPFTWPEFRRGGDGIALVAARDLPRQNDAADPHVPADKARHDR